MDTNKILDALKEERERLSRAIGVLESGSGGSRGRASAAGASSNGRRRRRHMSAEARARISAAQKKRWAARKKK